MSDVISTVRRLSAPDYPPATRGRVVVWGYLGSNPFGGMTWQVLQYVAGLRMLGFDVWYVEDTDAEVLDPVTYWPTAEYAGNIEYLKRHMELIGLPDRWAFRPPSKYGECWGAVDMKGLAELYASADAVINLCGSHELRADHDVIRCLVYLETDPVPRQVAIANRDPAALAELERYAFLFTYGENLGQPDCRVPVERFTWHATRPPVIPDWWQSEVDPQPGALFTTITSWQHTWKDVSWNGELWRWSKDLEFRKLENLPGKVDVPLELAVGGMGDEDMSRFRGLGWRLRDAGEVADPDVYRSYIRKSLGEFTVAKEQYVLPKTGWFSDRSVCYLAAGRPVVTQDTGFGKFIPCGEGLLSFSTEQEAIDAINSVRSDYKRHCVAAGDIAREYFGTTGVLGDMMRVVGLM